LPDAAGIASTFATSVDQITEAEWNDLLPQFADANLYQTWAYGAVSWGAKNLSHLLLKSAGQVVGMAQFRIVRVPLLSSGIAYLRWGPLSRRCDAPPDPDLLPTLLKAIADEYACRRRLLVRILPNVFCDDADAAAFEAACAQHGFQPSTSAVPYRTIRVDLPPPPEIIRKRFDQKWRNQLNAAERNGLTVREGTGDTLFAEFTAIYRELLARKQFETTVNVEEFARSEERRVGKECRSRWSPYHSSRRRHTRCLSDWSSDVCSSDLFSRSLQPSTASSSPANNLKPPLMWKNSPASSVPFRTCSKCASSFAKRTASCWPAWSAPLSVTPVCTSSAPPAPKA